MRDQFGLVFDAQLAAHLAQGAHDKGHGGLLGVGQCGIGRSIGLGGASGIVAGDAGGRNRAQRALDGEAAAHLARIDGRRAVSGAAIAEIDIGLNPVLGFDLGIAGVHVGGDRTRFAHRQQHDVQLVDHLGHQYAAAGDIPGAPPAALAHQRMGDIAMALDRGALHLADPAILDKPEHALIARRITQLIADRQLPRMARFGGRDAGCAFQRLGQRFFAENIFSGIQRRDHRFLVQGGRRGHRDKLHLRIGDKFGGRRIAAGNLERV